MEFTELPTNGLSRIWKTAGRNVLLTGHFPKNVVLSAEFPKDRCSCFWYLLMIYQIVYLILIPECMQMTLILHILVAI
jgi:hypothetical protein